MVEDDDHVGRLGDCVDASGQCAVADAVGDRYLALQDGAGPSFFDEAAEARAHCHDVVRIKARDGPRIELSFGKGDPSGLVPSGIVRSEKAVNRLADAIHLRRTSERQASAEVDLFGNRRILDGSPFAGLQSERRERPRVLFRTAKAVAVVGARFRCRSS